MPVGLMVLSDGIVHILKIEKNFNKSTKTILWLYGGRHLEQSVSFGCIQIKH